MDSSRKVFIGLAAILVVMASIGGISTVHATTAASVSSPFVYGFGVNGTLEESSPMDSSSSPYFWLNSGGLMPIADGVGKTVQGNLPSTNKWRLLYQASSPVDTDNGYHPQNLFRLVTRSKWQNFNQQAYFKITKDNLSPSPNRNQSNGLLLFNRYLDGQNLYYTGIRVDGYAVIKKKLAGRYYTIATKKILDGSYNASSNPNLIPKNTWIGIKSELKNLANGQVGIKVWTDIGKTGNWKLVLDASDSGSSYGSPITSPGYAGIRTDFMDVLFDDYRNTTL